MADFGESGIRKRATICIIIGAILWVVSVAILWTASGPVTSVYNWVPAVLGDVFFIVAFSFANGMLIREHRSDLCGKLFEIIELILLIIGGILFLVGHVFALIALDKSSFDTYWLLCLAGAACWVAGFGVGLIKRIADGAFCDPWQSTVGVILFFIGALLILAVYVLWFAYQGDGVLMPGLLLAGCVCLATAALFQLCSI